MCVYAYIYMYIYIYICLYVYRVSKQEYIGLRESELGAQGVGLHAACSVLMERSLYSLAS